VTTSNGIGGTRGVSRLSAPVLRHMAENPGAILTPADVRALAGVDADDGERLVSWLERTGLLVVASSGNEPVYRLADAWEQRRRRSRPLILLVEDHNVITSITEAVLTSEGYNVVLVRNPPEAHTILRVVAFDLILTDSFGPTLDLAMRVLGPVLRRSTGTPVVLFTDHRWNPARVQAEGFTEMITKPFEVEEFLSRVEQLAPVPRGTR
jgi:CheY-like chemotaxis protein